MLAFKGTYLTRWLIDPPIPEAYTLCERFAICFTQMNKFTLNYILCSNINTQSMSAFNMSAMSSNGKATDLQKLLQQKQLSLNWQSKTLTA